MNKKLFVLLPLSALVVLGGCVTVPTGPAVRVMPGTQKSFEQFQADDMSCRNYAYNSIGGPNAAQAGQEGAARDLAVASALGAAAGAAIGAVSGQAGAGAAIGAAAGCFGVAPPGPTLQATRRTSYSAVTTRRTCNACIRAAIRCPDTWRRAVRACIRIRRKATPIRSKVIRRVTRCLRVVSPDSAPAYNYPPPNTPPPRTM
jgi:hypothetical protein